MTKLTTLCNLSQSYTNHCILATGATLLSRASFNPAQIMSVTGHKSVSPLAIYQCVSNTEKLQMAKTLANHMMPQNKNDPLSDFSGVDLEECNFNLKELMSMPVKQSTNLKFPMSNNCTIGTINITGKEL